MLIEKGKENKIKEIKEKLNPQLIYNKDESGIIIRDSNGNLSCEYEKTEVSTEELLYIQVEQSRQQLIISKIFLFTFVILPIIYGLILLS